VEVRRRILKRYNGDESQMDRYETLEGTFYFRFVYRQMAALYGLYLIDCTKMTIDQ